MASFLRYDTEHVMIPTAGRMPKGDRSVVSLMPCSNDEYCIIVQVFQDIAAFLRLEEWYHLGIKRIQLSILSA
jgi:hypothetical protein